jgi:hypothetical protein
LTTIIDTKAATTWQPLLALSVDTHHSLGERLGGHPENGKMLGKAQDGKRRIGAWSYLLEADERNDRRTEAL